MLNIQALEIGTVLFTGIITKGHKELPAASGHARQPVSIFARNPLYTSKAAPCRSEFPSNSFQSKAPDRRLFMFDMTGARRP
jgi:hypothetical protein